MSDAELPPEPPPPPPPPPEKPEVGTLPSQQQGTASLEDLVKLIGPLATAYFEADERSQERQVTFQRDVIREDRYRFQWMIGAAVIVAIAVLTIAAILMARGKDDAAVTLIQLVVGLGAAGFGGYGISQSRLSARSTKEKE